MTRIKSMNGYTIYQARASDVTKYDFEDGSFYVYFSTDVRDFGMANSTPEYEGCGSLEEAEANCCGNFARAKEIVEGQTTAASFEEIVEIERRLDAGETVEEIEEDLVELTNDDEIEDVRADALKRAEAQLAAGNRSGSWDFVKVVASSKKSEAWEIRQVIKEAEAEDAGHIDNTLPESFYQLVPNESPVSAPAPRKTRLQRELSGELGDFWKRGAEASVANAAEDLRADRLKMKEVHSMNRTGIMNGSHKQKQKASGEAIIKDRLIRYRQLVMASAKTMQAIVEIAGSLMEVIEGGKHLEEEYPGLKERVKAV